MQGGEMEIQYTKFQKVVQDKLKSGRSLLLIAPTGLGKTLAVVGDLSEKFCKTVYAVPLRALGGGIKKEISEKIRRNNKKLFPVLHHGDIQESNLFGEEVIITTYDQVVCGVPGLPLSLPLKAGHAVAGALMMSRLILDETHLAWSISDNALSILLGIVEFRRKFGFQTVVLTATLPSTIANKISSKLNMDLIIAGEGETGLDESLTLRNSHRTVNVVIQPLVAERVTDKSKKIDKLPVNENKDKKINLEPLINKLINNNHKCIYFANTVDRLQDIYDRLISAHINADNITVLHNRMPRNWRTLAEERTYEYFGQNSNTGKHILLTTQVAEAGLDISAPLVISDPAPVDTLIQRAGRCARWFRTKKIEGEFCILKPPKTHIENKKQHDNMSSPYDNKAVIRALYENSPPNNLTWDEEKKWINKAWGNTKDYGDKVDNTLSNMSFALNLFDRAAQENKPGEIARTFREILTVEAAVEKGDVVHIDDLAERDLQLMLQNSEFPETSSISLGRAWNILSSAPNKCAVIRSDENGKVITANDRVAPGDILVVPSTIAYLHEKKGLCFGDGQQVEGAVLSSHWLTKQKKSAQDSIYQESRKQSLWEHSMGVVAGVKNRFIKDSPYRKTLFATLKKITNTENVEHLADLIISIAVLSSAFHDFGKSDLKWQQRAKEIEGGNTHGLIGRTSHIDGGRIGIPHTPPGYNAIIKTCDLLLHDMTYLLPLVRILALAAVRHHSSMLDPFSVKHVYQPSSEALDFVQLVLREIKAPDEALSKANEIIAAAQQTQQRDEIPLVLPNVDYFPIYSIVGRAILMSDREDAAGKRLEDWEAQGA
jgi:CRISPR-associated helicase Cas3